jgi:hypothetical protein
VCRLTAKGYAVLGQTQPPPHAAGGREGAPKRRRTTA